MLSFRIDEIPESGLDLDRELGEEWLKGLLLSQYSIGNNRLRLKFNLMKFEESVNVTGRMTLELSFTCGRCAENFPLHLEHDFASVFIARPAKGVSLKEGLLSDKELVVSYHDGVRVDLEPLIAEEFVLSLPQYPICSEGCKGLCPRCGVNLNETECGCKAEAAADTAWSKLRDLLPKRS